MVVYSSTTIVYTTVNTINMMCGNVLHIICLLSSKVFLLFSSHRGFQNYAVLREDKRKLKGVVKVKLMIDACWI